VLHEAALVRVLLQVVVLAQSEDEKAEVVGVDVDDHINGLKFVKRNNTNKHLKENTKTKQKQKRRIASTSMITSITCNKQMTNDSDHCF
jgi:hypothetical protein